MSETPNSPLPDDDLGLPIAELRGLDFNPGMDFVPGVRRRINRRSLAQHTVDLTVGGLIVFVREYISIIMESVPEPKPRNDGGEDRE